MQISIKSKSLFSYQLLMFILLGALFGGLVLLMLQSFVGGSWILIENSPVLTLLVYYGLGIILSTWYVQRDYVMYRKRTLIISDTHLAFIKDSDPADTFAIQTLEDIRKTQFIYRLVSGHKVTFVFKPKDEKRTRHKMLLVSKEDLVLLEKTIDPVHKTINKL